jgi:fatty-acyl-CoA synthase
VLIHDADFAPAAQGLREAATSLRVSPRGPEESAYGRAVAVARPLRPPHRATHDDVSTILYTSGTTGQPKGVIVTHGMTVWNAVNATAPAAISPETVFLCALPLFHTAGLNVFANPVFHAGGTVVVMPSFDPEQALWLIGDPRVGITHLYGVPAHYQFMAQSPGFASADLSRLVSAGVGSAPAPLALIEAWQARDVALWQTYGMTETGLQTMLNKADARRKLGSSGQKVLHTETRIVRADGTDAATGELGEIWARGPNVTPGYWNQPELTRASFTDGWLHTGDAALVDAEGFVFVLDRWKDMYISGGENVYPAEVENVLYQLQAVAEAAVIGVPDPRWGEVGRPWSWSSPATG